MKQHSLLRSLLLFVFLISFLSVPCVNAQTVTHKVVAGETLYKIARDYGVSVQQIIDANKGLSADAIKSGQTLTIPSAAFPKAQPVAPQQTVQVKYKEYKVKKKDTPYSLAKANGITVDELMAANPELKADGYKLKKGTVIKIPVKVQSAKPHYSGLSSVRVAVLLPMLGEKVENVRSLEFYRGFLMGVEQLKNRGLNVAVSAYNEPGPDGSVAQLMNSVAAASPDLVVGPVYPQHFADVASHSSERLRVVVPFSSKVQQVNFRPNVFVVNTPAEYENTLCADLFMSSFKKSDHFVFLHAVGGDKADLCQQLTKRMNAAGYSVTSVPLHGTAEELKTQLKSKGNGHFVFMSDNSSEATLAEILPLLKNLRSLMKGSTFSMVGYESWLKAASGSRAAEMREADSYLFATSYFYPSTADALRFTQEYTRWFGSQLLDCTPRMAPLGYDVALAMLGGLATFGYSYATQTSVAGTMADTPRLQSDLRFITAASGGGYVSCSMWLVRFSPDGMIYKYSAK